ncbi:amino acid ABC transporter ATP-binding protein [Lachnospiraceae bacterium 54-53]
MSESILSIRDIHKKFGDLEVLKGISFDIHKGEKIAILGPSGSGKSTVLRCINQLEKYDRGEIAYMGKPVDSGHRLHELRQHIGMVFQRFNVFNHMNVLENIIEAPVHVKKLSRNEAVKKARNLLNMVGLSDKETVMARNLSGGQQQRVAIARAMAMDPDVILFDEPTSALDPELVGEVLNVIRKVAEDGVSMVIVTHEMDFAREVADRILFMDGGVIVEDAPPREFFEQPRNDRIRQFIRKIERRD